jgi:MerR family transcriptional regulator/heat shock protein HspR
MKVKRNKGFFSISAVAKMFSVHQQTIRLYEKQGLITPDRSSGNTRLFSEDDIERLEEIIYLTHELGINLAGVEMVLKLKKQVSKMQKEMNDLFEKTQKNLDAQAFSSQQLIEEHAKRLTRIKKGRLPAPEQKTKAPESKKIKNPQEGEVSWEIEYED